MAEIDLRLELPLGESVSAVLTEPASGGEALYVFSHGAGAGMRHTFMEEMAKRLAEREIATLRYQFPYMDRGSRRPDRAPRLIETVRAACELATKHAAGRPTVAGGKSMGGRMTSMAQSEEPLPNIRSLAFVGFPLHPAGKPGTSRADHLAHIEIPMLFLQGDRDKLADLELLRPVLEDLGPRAHFHLLLGADHGFHVLKRSGRTDAEVLDEAADSLASWIRESSRANGEL